MAEYEYKTEDQFNVGFSETFSMSVKAPAIAKRIFDTYEHAVAFINNKRDTAVAGLVLSVFKDTNKNGIYQVIEYPTSPNGLGLKKIGGNEVGDGLENDINGKTKIKIESSILSTTNQDGKLVQNEMLTVSDKGIKFNVITDMGVMNNNIFEKDPSVQSFKDSLQLFRTDCKNPFKPNMGKTALENAKIVLNDLFQEENFEQGQNIYTATIPQTPYSFKDGEPIAVYYEEENNIVKIALAIVYVNFENLIKPISLSWFSNDDEKQESVTYNAGEGIVLDNNTNTFSTDSSIIKLGEMSDDPKLKGSIKVTNPIGNFKLKEVVTVDTAIKEIIKGLLTTVDDVEITKPSISFDLFSENDNIYKEITYEVGTPIKGNLKYHYPVPNQGKFSGWWLNSDGFIFAECPKDETSSYVFSDNLTNETKTSINVLPYDFGAEGIKEGISKITLNWKYKDSPKNNTITKNDGSETSKPIKAGEITVSRKYTGQYRYFIGSFEQTSINKIIITEGSQLLSLPNLKTGFCTVDGITTINSYGSSDKYPTIILAVPNKYKNIIKTCNNFGQEIDLSKNSPWVIQGGEDSPKTIKYKNGNKTTEYTIYIQYLSGGTIYENIQFK